MKYQGPWEGWRLLTRIAGILGLMTAAILGGVGTGEDGIRMLIRATARTSLVLFIAAFIASSIVHLWPSPVSKWMLRNRRQLGLSFALSHGVHLGGIIAARQVISGFEIATITLVGGGLAYLFIAAMAATSFDRAVAWLGRRRWTRLHTIGSYYIWTIFAQSYFGRAVTSPAYVPVALVLMGALGLRFQAARRRKVTVAVPSRQ